MTHLRHGVMVWVGWNVVPVALTLLVGIVVFAGYFIARRYA